MARKLDDPQTLAAVLYDRHTAIWSPATVDERLTIATEVVALAEASVEIRRRPQKVDSSG
jgi:hypothetical protein